MKNNRPVKLNRINSKKGFSLVETLVTVLLLLIVSSCASMAVNFGSVEYKKSMNQSMAQTLYSTVETVIEAQLKHAKQGSINYVSENGMVYKVENGSKEAILENAAYADLCIPEIELSYDDTNCCYSVKFSVCSGNDVLINGEDYNFDVLAVNELLGSQDEDASAYIKQKVQDSGKAYEDALNTVLKILYDELVADRLGGTTGQLSYVRIEKGVIASVCTYTERSKDGQNKIISEVDTIGLKKKIDDALAELGCSISNSALCRIFIDREGNFVSNVKEGGGYLKIGGQGAPANIKFVKNGVGFELVFENDEAGWKKK